MKTTILYFSPTGGTEQIAKHIGARLGITPVDITVFDYDMSFERDELIYFCFPVYGGRIPAPMYDRLSSFRGSETPAVMVAVYGNRAVEDALAEMSDLAGSRGFRTVGGCEMIAPHSLDRRFAADRPDASDLERLNRFVDKLSAQEVFSDITLPGNRPYKDYKGVGIYPTSGSNCTGCGTCSFECPAKAINPEKPHRPDTAKCISCMRCTTVCPFGNKRLPIPAKVAVAAKLKVSASLRKEPRFFLKGGMSF